MATKRQYVATLDEIREWETDREGDAPCFRVLETTQTQVLDVVQIPAQVPAGKHGTIAIDTYMNVPTIVGVTAGATVPMSEGGSDAVTTHLFERTVPLFVVEIDEGTEIRQLKTIASDANRERVIANNMAKDMEEALVRSNTALGRALDEKEELEGDVVLAKAVYLESETQLTALRESLREILDEGQWKALFPDAGDIDGVDF